MSVQVQCCGVAMLLVLFYFYKSQRKLSLRTGWAYWRMLRGAFAALLLDIASCIAITNMDMMPMLLVEIICKLYLASLAVETGFILQYLGTDVYPEKQLYHKVMMWYGGFAFVGLIAIFLLPIHYHIEKDTGQLYTYGPSVISTYIFAAGVMVVVIVRTLRSWHKMAKGRRDGVLISVALIFAAAIVQFFNNQLLIIGYFLAVGMAVLYLKLENPGYNIDMRTGLFNQTAFNLYATERYKNSEDFALIEIIYEPGSCRTEHTDDILMEVVNYLLSIPDVFVFKNVGNEILVAAADESSADALLEKLRERFSEPWGKEKDAIVNPYWIYVPDPHVVNDTVELVDMLRYVRANSVEFAEARFAVADSLLAQSISEEKQTTALILSALNEDRVEVFYQPIYSTAEHKFTAAEALVRIRGGDGQIIPPGKFIKAAESSGLILTLGETVFRKVCKFIHDNDLSGMGLHYIEVNLSVIQCGYEHLADEYITILQQNNIPPGMINLEITESASLDTKKVLLNNMRKLMDYGVSFSLDDFGTGQSNLNYIIDMPVDIVKFDREMTNAYFENSKAKYIMDAAMDMIHGLNLSIVSEGVETEDQLRALEDLNIKYIQGFYFSKPLPANEFLDFISVKNNVPQLIVYN